MCRIENNTFSWKWKFQLHRLYPRWSYKYGNQEEPERMVVCKLKNFYIPGVCHVGNLEKTGFFHPFLSLLFKLQLIRKHFERQRETTVSKERESHLWFHVPNGTTQLSTCRMTNSLPQQQQQEMLSHNLNAVEQSWPLGDTGQGRRTKSHRRKGRGRKWPGGQLQLNIC